MYKKSKEIVPRATEYTKVTSNQITLKKKSEFVLFLRKLRDLELSGHDN